MPQLDEYLRQLAPSMTQWRRDFHLHAESGWLEFRTASKVADILDLAEVFIKLRHSLSCHK